MGWRTFQQQTFQPQASTPDFSTPDFSTMNSSTMNFPSSVLLFLRKFYIMTLPWAGLKYWEFTQCELNFLPRFLTHKRPGTKEFVPGFLHLPLSRDSGTGKTFSSRDKRTAGCPFPWKPYCKHSKKSSELETSYPYHHIGTDVGPILFFQRIFLPVSTFLITRPARPTH